MGGIRNLIFLYCGWQDAESESAEIGKIVSVDVSSRPLAMMYDAQQLSQKLASLPGVMQVLIADREAAIYLKINRSLYDEKRLQSALRSPLN